MKQAPYSIVNNRLLIDAVFHRDFHGSDSTVFAAGSSKNGMSPVNWSCPVAQNVPDKNDILDAFVHVSRLLATRIRSLSRISVSLSSLVSKDSVMAAPEAFLAAH